MTIRPWQDIKALEENLSTHRDTIKKWIRTLGFPRPVVKGSKELWKWEKVDAWMESGPAIVEEQAIAEGVRNETRKAVHVRGSH